MATSFLDKTGLGALWTKIKSTFALKSEIPDSTSDLTNDSGFITTADIAQSDWNQNDNESDDYIKNRVCYTDDPEMAVIATGTIAANNIYTETVTSTSATELLHLDDYPDLGGTEYSFTLGETTYTGTVYSVDEGGWFTNIIGNPHMYNDSYPDNNKPFIFDFYSLMLTEAVSEDTSFSVSMPVSQVHKLDDKYLNGALIKRGTGLYSVTLNGERVGLTASGEYSVAEGVNTTASGANAHAEGDNTIASEYSSHAEGSSSKAIEWSSHAEGGYTTAAGYSSHSEGSETKALSNYSHSEGFRSVASGQESHGEGCYTVASGEASHSEGGALSTSAVLPVNFGVTLTGEANATTYNVNSTTYLHSLVGFRINGIRVISETRNTSSPVTITLEETLSSTAITSKSYIITKNGTSASGANSHSEGFYSSATGYAAHVEGFGTYAKHRSQHVFGEWNNCDNSTATTDARGNFVEIVGNGTYASHSNARTLDWSGNEVLAGKLTVGTAPTANMDVATKQYVDNAVAGSGSAVTYTLSISNNVITLTGSDGSTSSVTLPVYAGGVSS